MYLLMGVVVLSGLIYDQPIPRIFCIHTTNKANMAWYHFLGESSEDVPTFCTDHLVINQMVPSSHPHLICGSCYFVIQCILWGRNSGRFISKY